MCVETWLAMAHTVEDVRLCARKGATSSVVRTWSTSYFERASSSERGSPDQITLSGSMGGMNSVDFSARMSYVK
jgi:hypothetical protein